MEESLREEGLVLRSLLLPVFGGELNAELWTRELEVRGTSKINNRRADIIADFVIIKKRNLLMIVGFLRMWLQLGYSMY